MSSGSVPDTKLTCRVCHGELSLKTNHFTECEGDIETVGLKCPHCGDKVIACRTNSEIRALQERVRKATEKFRANIVAGMPPSRAERSLKLAQKRLEAAYKALNGRI